MKNVNLWQYFVSSSLIKIHINKRSIFLAKKKKDEGLSCLKKKEKKSVRLKIKLIMGTPKN